MTTNNNCPTWFKVIAVVAVLWNLAGVFAFYTDVTMSDAAVAALSSIEQSLRAQVPSWLYGVYGVAVIAGLAGSVLLLMRRALATTVLAVSLAAILVQFGYVLAATDTLAVRGNASAIMPGLVAAIGAGLLWLSVTATARGWSK